MRRVTLGKQKEDRLVTWMDNDIMLCHLSVFYKWRFDEGGYVVLINFWQT